MNREDITLIFDQELKALFHEKVEILKFLLTHERRHLALDNLTHQVRLVLFNHKPKRASLEKLVKDIARMFAKASLDEHKAKVMSASERALRIQKANYINDAETTFLKDQEKEALSDTHKVFVPGFRDSR